MNMQDFCYWLQGFFEINDSNQLTPKQVDVIREHLNLVFKHVVGAPVAHVKPATPVSPPFTGGAGGAGVQGIVGPIAKPYTEKEIQDMVDALKKGLPHPFTTTYC